MVWGLVVSYLEGRRASELLLAGLSCSFILASGVVKDVGRWLMRVEGVSEWWMPFATAALFAPAFLVAVMLLSQLPSPDRADRDERSPRSSMSANDKLSFLRRFAAPLALLLIAYFFLTAFRDYRDNYGVEIFSALGYAEQPALFTATELPVALGVLVVLGALSFIRDNRLALKCVFFVMAAGLITLSGSTILLRSEFISGTTWMLLIGLGSYLTYVPFGSVLFDRLIAHTRSAGTAVFGIYLADALGYTGSVLVQLYADLGPESGDRLEFFISFTHFIAWGGCLLTLASAALWFRATPRSRA